jgi:myotubularin-related protein 14
MSNVIFILRVESIYNTAQMRELIKQARYARCRSRFAVPVIMFEGKVCLVN